MVGLSDYAKKAELMDQLLLGIEDRPAVFVTYRSLWIPRLVPKAAIIRSRDRGVIR
jgi:hypothetical protein